MRKATRAVLKRTKARLGGIVADEADADILCSLCKKLSFAQIRKANMPILTSAVSTLLPKMAASCAHYFGRPLLMPICSDSITLKLKSSNTTRDWTPKRSFTSLTLLLSKSWTVALEPKHSATMASTTIDSTANTPRTAIVLRSGSRLPPTQAPPKRLLVDRWQNTCPCSCARLG